MGPSEFKKTRRDLGLSINTSARELGVSPRTVARWQAGDTKVHPSAVKLLDSMKQSKPSK